MEVKTTLKDLIRESALYKDFIDNLEPILEKVEESIRDFILNVEEYVASGSKQNYISLVDSIIELHFASVLLTMLLEENDLDPSEVQDVIDELENLLNANDSPLHFVENDRDLMTIGKLISMSLYYSGDVNDPNEVGDDFETPSSVNKVHPMKISSKKLRMHILKTRSWSLLK